MLTTFLSVALLPLAVCLSNSSVEDLTQAGFRLADITAHDGVTLKSIYFDPRPGYKSDKNPTIIFISSWGMNKWEYVIPADRYARDGYTIVSYTARGFWESGGVIDMAGPNDMADLSTVIDWTIENTNADPNRIGVSGISYGGGISLLGSAMDSRIKSAVAMSCWVDMAESFLGNGETIREEAVRALQVLAEITGKPSEDLELVFDDYFSNTNLEFLYEFTVNSSAVNFIEQINDNGAAIFIANALGDSLFTPNQFPPFFDELTVPKHIEFAPGDHAGPELPGIFGLPDQVWHRAGQWNDFYLKDNKSGPDDDMPMVIFNAMNGREIEKYNSMADVSTGSLLFELQSEEVLSGYTPPVNLRKRTSDVAASLTTGATANISGGIAYITETVDAYLDVQKPVRMEDISRTYGVVFASAVFTTDVHIRGIPHLQLYITPTASSGTLIVYLLSVGDNDIGHIFTFSPWTFKDVTPGQQIQLDVNVTMSSYDMPKGNRLAVVISSRDRLYLDQSPPGAKIDFFTGSILTIPINA